MLIADIKNRLSNDPLEQFRIRSSSGGSREISTTFLLALMKSKLFIAVPNSDRWAALLHVHVAALESAGNAHASRASRGKRQK